MEIIENYSLKLYNTFGIEAKAKYFADVATIQDLRKVLVFRRQKDLPILFIGGGSNMLFVDDFPGVVLKLNLKGIEIINEDDDFVCLSSIPVICFNFSAIIALFCFKATPFSSKKTC